MNKNEEFFKRRRFTVKEDVVVTGYSGVRHHFPLLLSKEEDDVAVEYSDGADIELDVAKLSLKCRDSGISNAILILNKDIPISEKVSMMARENGIRIMNSSDMKDVGRAG